MSDASSEYSRLPNLRDLTIETRRALVSDAAGLSQAARVNLAGENSLQEHIADGMIENVIGKFELPLGVATNFKINNRDYLIPMAVEEPSVVAALAYGQISPQLWGVSCQCRTTGYARANSDLGSFRPNRSTGKNPKPCRPIDCRRERLRSCLGFLEWGLF